ncbi:probable myosin-binding protein 5 [Euphorbia lathyris]|uniref:probable myosin-binding protein 5 n=1 Tax=Euphorbia lathyris TaxID=212925 RepID=UPI003313FC89
MAMARRSFKNFVEKELGKFAHFLIYALLEWVLIFILFIDGFLAFFANEFARFFELKIPCLLCTRIDHVLVRRAADFYYNDSICESHKKDVSYLAYCHDHKKLSHIRKMCDGCLLSFASEKPSDSNSYKSQVGNLHKDIELLLDNDQEHPNHPNHHHHHNMSLSAAKKDDLLQPDKSSQNRCSCCGEPLKMKFYVKGKGSNITTQAPAPSPRAAFVNLRNERNRNMDLPNSRFAELKFSSNDLELNEDEDGMHSSNLLREDIKAATMRMLSEFEEMGEERTPNFGRGNRFFGIPLTDSANATPRLAARILRKSPLEKTEFATDSAETSAENEADGSESKGQARLDRKAFMSLYMELDEERSASTVAANNAMAMITRLQAEKAEFQMEALQYQRMMEEQAEYDQEALQSANELAAKRDEEIKSLEGELDVYRSKFGDLSEEDYARSGDEYEYYHDINSQLSSYVERPEFLSPTLSSVDGHIPGEILLSNDQYGVGTPKSQRGFQLSRFCDLSRLKSLNMRMNFLTEDGAPSSVSSSDNVWPAQENKLMRLLLQLHERVKGLETDNEFAKPASPRDAEKEKLLTEICDNLRKLRDFIAMPFGDDDDA